MGKFGIELHTDADAIRYNVSAEAALQNSLKLCMKDVGEKRKLAKASVCVLIKSAKAQKAFVDSHLWFVRCGGKLYF